MEAPTQTKQKKVGKIIARILLRTLLVLFTAVLLIVGALYMVCDLIFNGPSESARNVLTMSMLESSGMKWFPALFIGEEKVLEIQAEVNTPLPDDVSDTSQVVIQQGSGNQHSSEWENHPDGIRIESLSGDTYNAHIMLIRDPSSVYLATSSNPFSMDILGTSIDYQMEVEGAIAGINAGAFYDNGTSSPTVGSVPQGLVIAGGEVVWNSGWVPQQGFVGFNRDNILVVAQTMTAGQAQELNIRDGCCFGPVLVMNGTVNQSAYNENSGYNPRTAIGQRADGTILFLCVDGRQTSSLGATYADIIDIMVEYGAVNACNLDGGSSTIMYYRDQYGKFGEEGKLLRINNYSLLQDSPRRMPTFFMVRPANEED